MAKYLNKDGAFKGIMEVPDPYYGGSKGFELVCIPTPNIIRFVCWCSDVLLQFCHPRLCFGPQP